MLFIYFSFSFLNPDFITPCKLAWIIRPSRIMKAWSQSMLSLMSYDSPNFAPLRMAWDTRNESKSSWPILPIGQGDITAWSQPRRDQLSFHGDAGHTDTHTGVMARKAGKPVLVSLSTFDSSCRIGLSEGAVRERVYVVFFTYVVLSQIQICCEYWWMGVGWCCCVVVFVSAGNKGERGRTWKRENENGVYVYVSIKKRNNNHFLFARSTRSIEKFILLTTYNN